MNRFSQYVNEDGVIDKPLSSNDVCHLGFAEKDLSKLTTARLKAFKKACYKEIGNRFFCCEFRCEKQVDTPELIMQQDISENNLKLINKVLSIKSKSV